MFIDPKSKLAAIILPFGFLIMPFMLWFEVAGFLGSLRSLRWPAADGVILLSETEWLHVYPGIPIPRPKISYRYAVAGQKYENETVSFGLLRGTLTWGYASRKVETYRPGKAVVVYYNPERPGESCLERGGLGWEDCLLFSVSIYGCYMGMKLAREVFIGLRAGRQPAVVK
jgi:hypothetical protein